MMRTSLIVAFTVSPWFVTAARPADQAGPLPRPGIGVFFRAEDVPAMREKIQREPCLTIYLREQKHADAGLAGWAADCQKYGIPEIAAKLPDLTMEFVPKEFAPDGAKEAGRVLERHVVESAPAAAFVYLMTGDRRYADFAWDVFQQAAKANRWGWFPWAGSHMPQIHYGTISRSQMLILDCVWDTLDAPKRKQALEVIAEKCVEPYYRIVLHAPGMGLYHLRSRNQGSNALAAAVIGSVMVGDAVPENRVWLRSLLQTFHWAIAHDIGWMGDNLDPGMGGYWSVSMQNLYTAARAIYNVRRIDLRTHPGFDQAVYYPIIHESTVPAVNMFDKPIPLDAKGPMGIISGKALELPGNRRCGAWWLDFAREFPDSPARYFVRQNLLEKDTLRVVDGHQAALGRLLAIAWWDDRLQSDGAPPASLAQFTDRMAGIRSGYGFGQTYLYFNGDLFLSARRDILATTSGMSWHFPWHQYQIAESGVETEGELFAPSMVLQSAFDSPQFAGFRAVSGTSNVKYYPLVAQRESYKNYDQRQREVVYVRPTAQTRDYFVFVDQVRHREDQPRWYAWTWHVWSSAANPEKNFGRFVPHGQRAVRAERPNADLWIHFITPDRLAFEQHGIPSQPLVSYQMDHNVQMLRAVAGAYAPTEAPTVVIAPSAWPELDALKADAPPSKPRTDQTIASQVVGGLVPGTRYRWSVLCKELGYRVYEATAWEITLELLDKDGGIVAEPTTPYGHPHPLRLGAPKSDLKTHDWTETVQYFDAPPGAVACRAKFRAVGGAHYFELGSLWLKDLKLEPVGVPPRSRQQQFVAVVMPLDKGEAAPQIESLAGGRARIKHADGIVDELTVEGGVLEINRQRGSQPVASLADTRRQGEQKGALKTNSDSNARRLEAGLKPLLDELLAERDALLRQGRRNLAAGAKVTASATLDPRFDPAKVVDGQVAEYPADGHLDYTLGTVLSSGRFVGYGRGKESLLVQRDAWPLYVKPTYWLLPEDTLGHVEFELPEPAKVSLVRLLNTSNCGLNDFAAHHFVVELYDGSRELLSKKEAVFGHVCDRPFRQAFFVPKWFSSYTESYAGMLEPGLTVPFGDGWKEVELPTTEGVKFVRVAITKFWGIGGGLNEVQIYGPRQ